MAAPEKTAPAHRPADFLLTGDEYRESLRDGRRVVSAGGEEIEDVTTHPALRYGIDTLAEIFDAQFDPAARDVMTYVDEETGKRASITWKVPRTVEDVSAIRAT